MVSGSPSVDSELPSEDGSSDSGSELPSEDGSADSSSVGSEPPAVEGPGEPDDEVAGSLGEVEGYETLPPVEGRGDPEDEVPEIVPEGELPAREPAPVVDVPEPDL